MNKTSIEWTDYTWNPVTGCNKISAGCKNCYAETLANRFWGDRKFTDVVMHHERLIEPKKNRKKWAGKKVFVCSMSDLFHESISFQFILNVFTEIESCPNVIFQILTKRPERALEYFHWRGVFWNQSDLPKLKNLWVGVSCENQEQADKRIPLLLQIPAAVRFLSCEPLIGEVDIKKWLNYTFVNEFGSHNLGWVIAGGESGHGARPMHPDWVRSLRDQCQSANVPFFFKQWGEWIDNQNMPRELVNNKFKEHVFGSGHFSTEVWKVGKSKSGNMLDGKQYLEFPWFDAAPLSPRN